MKQNIYNKKKNQNPKTKTSIQKKPQQNKNK